MGRSTLYNPLFVRALFDEMARSYGLVNYVASFGFCERWRKQCVAQLPIEPGMTVCDLMSGMSECLPALHTALRDEGTVIALDFSAAMCRRAREHQAHFPTLSHQLFEENVLANSIPDGVADCLISTFGLKTFSDEQLGPLAAQIARLLKPGGQIALLEISVPRRAFLRLPYLFYVKYGVPLLGRLFLGNPDNYRLLGLYTERFGSCERAVAPFEAAGLRVSTRPLFFGCATLLLGHKPE